MRTLEDFVEMLNKYLQKNPDLAKYPIIFYWKDQDEALFLQGIKKRQVHYYGKKIPGIFIELKEPGESGDEN